MSAHGMTTFCVAALTLNRSSGRPNGRSNIRYLRTSQLARSYRTGVQSGSPYLLLSNVNEPVSLPVRNIMRPIIHVSRYFSNVGLCQFTVLAILLQSIRHGDSDSP